jgi:hypothetical protein
MTISNYFFRVKRQIIILNYCNHRKYSSQIVHRLITPISLKLLSDSFMIALTLHTKECVLPIFRKEFRSIFPSFSILFISAPLNILLND